LIASLSGIFVNILAAVVLVKPLQIGGLALSVPLGLIVQAIILFIIIRAKLKYREGRTLLASYGKILFSGGVMALVIRLSLPLAGRIFPADASHYGLFPATGFLTVLGVLVYIACLFLVRFQELRTIWQAASGRLRKKERPNALF